MGIQGLGAIKSLVWLVGLGILVVDWEFEGPTLTGCMGLEGVCAREWDKFMIALGWVIKPIKSKPKWHFSAAVKFAQ